MRVLILAEYYPRAADPVLGVWAHRQALAARDAGADVRVLVLHRPIPPASAVRNAEIRKALAPARQPHTATIDGLHVRYLYYASPPRRWSYPSWGAWAAPALRRILDPASVDLIHAHYAVPAGDAARRASPATPLVVSVHSHDPLGGGGANARATLAHAGIVLANSAGSARRAAAAGARHTCVVHLGTDVPQDGLAPPTQPTLVTVAHLFARKRHADVLAALALLRHRHPALRYAIVGDGPERRRLQRLAESLGLSDRVEFRGQLPPAQAIAAAQRATLFVLPSVDEALGVAYVEAMAAGVPVMGCRGEDGPEEIAAAGGGIVLVPARSPRALADQIDQLLTDPSRLEPLRHQARATVERAFTWERCGAATIAAYQRALEQPSYLTASMNSDPGRLSIRSTSGQRPCR